MLHFTRLVYSAILLAPLVYGRPDSAIDEPAVSAPDGVPQTDNSGSSSTSSSTSTSMSSSTSTSTSMSMSTSTGSSESNKKDIKGNNYGNSYSSTSSAYEAMSTPMYGSGQSNWGGSGYNDCVQQCISKYSAPPVEWKPTATSGHSGSSGTNGATHTVIVAPRQGVLRYVPFALNASVGDTVVFRWNANNHTVTKGSALQICNQTSEQTFTSGIQLKDFEFTQVVKNTETIWFYCNFPTHCQKGMFGAINPPMGFGSDTNVDTMAQTMVQQSPEMSAVWTKTNNDCKGNKKAAAWGGHFDMKNVPVWAREHYVHNVMYTRSFLASNPETFKDDGKIDMSNAATVPLKFPDDVKFNLATPDNSTSDNSTSSNSTSSNSTSGNSTSSSSAASSTASKSSSHSGSNALASPHMLVVAMAALVTFFAL